MLRHFLNFTEFSFPVTSTRKKQFYGAAFFNEVAVSPLIKELSRFANEEMIAKDFCFERICFSLSKNI